MKKNFFIVVFFVCFVFVTPNKSNAYSSDPKQFISEVVDKAKKILIDTSSIDETRIALIENGKLDDFEIETIKKNAYKGDVYLAKITRVEPSLQAAFVDYGANRHGFLPLTEIHPDYFKIPVSDQEILKKLSSQIQHEEVAESEIVNNEENNSLLSYLL